MRIIIARTMPIFSMDVYADGLVTGLKTVRPEWEIIEARPNSLDKKSSSWTDILSEYYKRSWHYPYTLTRQEADIFHVIDHSYGHLVYWLKKTGKTVVVTCHDLVNFIYPENLYAQARLPHVSMATWKFAVRSMKSADRIIGVSHNTVIDATRILNLEPDSIDVVPNAVDYQFRRLSRKQLESFRQQHNVSPGTIYLLNVGTVHLRKNILTILQVLKKLKERGLAIHLWKVGSDFTDEQKTFIQNYGLEKFITYLGQPDIHTLVQIYNAADVLLSPSLYEGFGMTVLEAMACGTPVITSNVSSLPEVAGDAAILVDPMDVKAIVEGICRLQNDSAYRKCLIDKELARVKLFTWRTTAEQIAKIYEKVVEQRKEKKQTTSLDIPSLVPIAKSK